MSASKTIVKYGGTLVLASAGLFSFLGKWEDGRAKPAADTVVYADKLAHGLPTTCLGLTNKTSPYPVIVGEVWSAAKCEEVGRLVLEKTQLRLADCIKTRVSQNTFDALSSHAHNLGAGSTCASRALALINAGQLREGCRALAQAPDGMPVWSYVPTGKRQPDGKVEMKFVAGLYARRVDEWHLCERVGPA